MSRNIEAVSALSNSAPAEIAETSKRDRTAAQVRVFYKSALLSAFANIANGGILAVANRSIIEPEAIAVWLAWIGFAAAMRGVAWWLQRSRDPEFNHPVIWRNAAIASAGLAGIGWGLAPIIFLAELSPFATSPGTLVNVAITITFMAGMAAGSMASFGTIPAAFRLYVVLTLVPYGTAFALVSTEPRLMITFAAAIYLLFLLSTGRSYSDLFNRAADSNARNTALVDLLTRENSKTEKLNDALQQTQSELRNANEGLEHRVRERTAELNSTLVNLEREMSGRQSLELRLIEAQKMEALGQLTGGVAHDFNNLLTVILGNLELLRDHSRNDAEMNGAANRALSAVMRGTSLTWRLLAFSRRQVLRPEITDVGEFATQMVELLERTLSENIEVRIEAQPDTWPVLIDTAELQNVLINLAINARDAMPDGGSLTVRTENRQIPEPHPVLDDEVAPGDYVTITVIDTGTGMDEETLRRAAEPFYTTKSVGSGTGLGLSIAYGFLRQSDGHIGIESYSGQGTAVTLYIPRADSDSARPAGPSGHTGAGEGKIVFVVEDDADVRDLTAKHLQLLGYEVITAPNGVTALHMIDEGVAFDLLLTDVVMPGGISGPDLVREITNRGIDVPKLLCSGHTSENLFGIDGFPPDVELLSKPFGRDELAKFVQRAFGQHDPT